MKKLLVTLFISILSFSFVSAQPTDTLSGDITSTLTLNPSKRYLLWGEVKVKQGGVIVIPPGTIIYGHKASKGSLIIERGGIINAIGTPTQPIIFTSAFPPGQRNAGDWGGVVILGRARINTTTGADTAAIEGFANPIYYGGQNDDDSSGVMKYVRIEYAGIALAPNNEINGLTLGGVGRKTIIEYIMVSYGGDDSFEWFGGTVNCKYLISYYGIDDDFDTDNGFRGNIQFGLAIRSPLIADVSGSNGFESDNNGAPNYNTPRTQATFSNMTLIGPKQYDTTTVNPNFQNGFHLRRNSLQNCYNSVFMGWPKGILFDGIGVANACIGDTIKLRSLVFAGISGKNFDSIRTGTTGFNPTGFMLNPSYLNDTLYLNSDVQLTNAYGGFNNNNWQTSMFIPQPGSLLLNTSRVTNVHNINSFFDNVNFRGAFGSFDWGAGWANFRPDTVNYNTVGISQISSQVPSNFKLEQNYPNPFNPSTIIKFSLTRNEFVSLIVYDITGKEIEKLVNTKLEAGTYAYQFNASNLSSGIYFYTLQAGNFIETKRMIFIK